MTINFDINALLKAMADVRASDLHLKDGRPPMVRIDGELRPFETPPLTGEIIFKLLEPIMSEKIKKQYDDINEADFSYTLNGIARFRVNVFRQRNQTGAVLRRVPLEVPTIEKLGLPPVLTKLADKENGLILVTGPTGSGKSTTLAAMVEHINGSRPVHIMTIEDPIEFVYQDKVAVINQRELGLDTDDLSLALKSMLRQDPDIILMGEMRDPETIRFGITAAETGHLVFATLHTNDAPQTIERILDTMPHGARDMIRGQLSLLMRGIVCQRLAKRADGKGRLAALEIMVVNETIRQLIAEGRMSLIHQSMLDGSFYGMQTFNQAIYKLVSDGMVSEEGGLDISDNPEDLRLMYRGVKKGAGTIQIGSEPQSATIGNALKHEGAEKPKNPQARSW